MNTAEENDVHVHLMSTQADEDVVSGAARSKQKRNTSAASLPTGKRLRKAAEAPLDTVWRQSHVERHQLANRALHRRAQDDECSEEEREEEEAMRRSATLEAFSVANAIETRGEATQIASADDDDDDCSNADDDTEGDEKSENSRAGFAPEQNAHGAADSDPRHSAFKANLRKRPRIAPPRLERVNGPAMVRPLDSGIEQRSNREAIGHVVSDLQWPPLSESDTDYECFWILRFLENAFGVRDYADERIMARGRRQLDQLADDMASASASNSDSDDDHALPRDLRRTGPGTKSAYRFFYSARELARVSPVQLIFDRMGMNRPQPLAQSSSSGGEDDEIPPQAAHGNVYDIERIETLLCGMIAYVLLLKRNLTRYVTLFPYQARLQADEGVLASLNRSIARDPDLRDDLSGGSGDDETQKPDPPRNVNQRLRTLLDRIANMRVAIRALNLIGSTNSRPHGLPIELAAYGLLDSAESMQVVADDDTSSRQNICSLLLQECYVKNYRRCGDDLFAPKIYGGHNTQSYVPLMSIEDFVWRLPDPVSQRREWLEHTSERSVQRWIVEHLTKVRYESMLPDLVRARDQWSFRNGIYVGHLNRFYRYGKSYAEDTECPFHTGAISARYFDEDFDEDLVTMPANRIRTDTVETIQNSQKWSEDVKGWMWVAFGRLFYDVGQYDDWQFAPYLKGLAGTGKSTLVKMMTKFYDASAVGTLSNDMEETFGLMSLHDKDLLVAPEIRPNFKLAQAHFQTMVSGETMTVPVKHQTPKAIGRWLSPLLLAGNVFPMWIDSGGSLARRILPFLFDEPIDPSKSITRLEEKIDAELQRVLVKANRFYFAAVAAYGDCNIWNAVPSEFLLFRQSMREATDNVQKFCGNATDTSDPEYFITLEQFIKSMRLMAKARNWHQTVINDADVVRSLKQKFASEKPKNGLAPHRIVEHKCADGTKEFRIYGMRLPREFDVTDEPAQF